MTARKDDAPAAELQVEVAQGAMRLLAPPETTGALISLPAELLLPIEAAQWSDSADALQLLQLHVELYNATGKLHWWSSQHPARLVDASANVAAALAPLKPAHGAKVERSAAEGFLATRSFG